MEPDASQPPQLTAKDVAKVESLIDPEPLPCGGRGLVEGAARTTRWSFDRKSTVAVARYHLGYGWPVGILRRTCPVPEVADRCLTHRTDDGVSGQVPLPMPDQPPNTVPESQDRALTPPGGNGPAGGARADEGVLRGWRWATGRTPAGGSVPQPLRPSDGPGGLAPGVAPRLTPGPVTSGDTGAEGDTTPLPPKGGQGLTPVTEGAGATSGDSQVPDDRHPPPRHRRRGHMGRLWWRVAVTVAVVAAALALVYAAHASIRTLDRLDPPPIGPFNTEPAEAPPPPTPSPPTAEPATTTTGPCTPSDCPVFDKD